MLDEMRISDITSKTKGNILICAVERGEQLIIPNGDTVLKARDRISIVGASEEANDFFRQVGIVTNQVKNIMIAGGGTIAYYLAKMLIASGISVKIMEKDMKRCETLCELLPRATIVYGDGTDRDLLKEEGLEKYESFAALTNIDEENVLLSLYAKKVSNAKVITKINRITFDEVISELDLDTVIHPKDITSELIIRYVRSMKNSLGSNVETRIKLSIIRKRWNLSCGKTPGRRIFRCRSFRSKRVFWWQALNRKGKIIIPRGFDMMKKGDTVIVITQLAGLNDIDDILAK